MKRYIDANAMTLEKYLSIDEKTLMIPYSQRPYEWGELQVKRLFDDFMRLSEEENADNIHMLNFFTISEEDNQNQIFDGQQRTITSLLFLSVIIRKINELGDKDLAEEFLNDFIIKSSKRSNKDGKKKLIFNDELEDVEKYFYQLVKLDSDLAELDPTNIDTNNPTIIHMYKNYVYMIDCYNKYIESSTHSIEFFKESTLLDQILRNVQLIEITTDTNDLAMRMFETLNNTGKKLEDFYVLKNDLVTTLGENGVKSQWRVVESNLDGINFKKFLVSVATLFNGYTTENSALTIIYQKYDKNNYYDMHQLLNILETTSRFYYEIINGIVQDNKEYIELAKAINIFGFKQYYPVILAMLVRGKSIEEINQVMKKFLKLAIVNLFICKRKTNELVKPLSELARNIYAGLDIDITGVIEEHISSDYRYMLPSLQIDSKKTSQKKRIKFLLSNVYNMESKECKIFMNESIHYEHILPQNPSDHSEWLQNFPDEEERKIYINKIGNGTLLLGKINQRISNNDFSDKRELLKESNIEENHRIAENIDWTKKEIDNRCNELSEKIIQYLDTL